MPTETKFTLALLLILLVCFGVVVWQKMEHQKHLLAAMRDKSQQTAPGETSPFDEYEGDKGKPAPPPHKKPTPPTGTAGKSPFDEHNGEPRRLPVDEKPRKTPLNPFDEVADKPRVPRDQTLPTGKHEPAPKQPTEPPKGLFGQSEPPAKPTAPPKQQATNPFDPWTGATTTVEKPKTTPLPPAQKPIDAFPASQTKVQPSGNPFDQATQGLFPGAPPKTAQNDPAPKNPMDPANSGFQPAQPAGPPQQNPFDQAGNSAGFPPSAPGKPTVDTGDPSGGFNPFTPVKHTEEKPEPPKQPQGAFNPFESNPIPTQPTKPSGGGDPTPPANNKPPEKNPGPSPFDGFPLPPKSPDKPKQPEPKPEPPKRPQPPAKPPQFENPLPPKQPGAGQSGFPTNGNFTPPGSIDQKPTPVYTVKADETYWSISKKLYGSIKYFQALAEHNRHRVGDPKRLRPGMKILVPEAEILDKLYGKLIPGGPANKPKEEQGPDGLFYTNNGQPMFRVGEEDTLSDIAYRHLGRASRWVEIYNLNRSLLKNPDRMKPGTVLKMPSDASRISLDNSPRIIR
ncbi:LysM peptidoglycan-binding domain-containing protein [bacterium]|uniref:Peptidoglycan-binding lysin domain protein n=1 Tax=Rubinisphaera brasiliensis (strain ATCC 49424 / DSM 5305 / JCM 21570 / IAM 15109 / NBRC 103401 / IFAM 1448) TaxID=756272 RepID=F0SQF2_RUBBR|nr:LysM peptidoglycan-binding domain-containing protein [Rubinisphaera brasiliensis]ADY57927.1 Peptidoglycan-binding lysin domain protein [Rubinisphaera brasiliensis DSM 5305]MBR9802199.1 LysM peptidoglycan-binding domain-containing protein [bacterium]